MARTIHERLTGEAENLQNTAGKRKIKVTSKIKNQLISLRKSKNITQREIGEATGMVTSNITRIERDDYDPSLEILIRYAEALGYTLEVNLIDKSTGQKTEISIEPEIEVEDLNPHERRMLTYYRGLSQGGKRMLGDMARDLSNIEGVI